MKKHLPLLFAATCGLWILSSWRTPKDKPDQIPANRFGSLPCLSGGRTQPLDSVARNTLLQLREKQTLNTQPWMDWWKGPKMLSASQWMLEMFFNQQLADTRPVFRIVNTDLKGLLGLPLEPDLAQENDGKHFSWKQVTAKMEALRDEARRAQGLDQANRTAFDRAVLQLWNGVSLYMKLQNTVQPQNALNWEKEIQSFITAVPAGREAAKLQQAGQPHNEAALSKLINELQRATVMNQVDPPLVIAPVKNPTSEAGRQWTKLGEAIFNIARGDEISPSVLGYARMGTAYRANDPVAFSAALEAYLQDLTYMEHGTLQKCVREQTFTHLEPFYKSMVLYVMAGLCALVFTLAPSSFAGLRRTGHLLTITTLFVHTAGLVYRMVLEGRPPVTNLYSSAVFIGWGACCLGLLLERAWKNGVGIMVSSSAGFLTLIIAHHLSLSGDTMQMMQAVLDTNFWLATHVVIVTLGYSATFVAGLLAALYVMLGFFTRALHEELAKSLSKMVYGIICFAALFSLVGTVLGGIWADQSWGRFWGWDAKENGALMIVLWNALFLHARWGGLAKGNGLMAIALGGNIVTSWSWFGVNLLGIGLHSYGFMSAAFNWLMLFVASQVALIAISLLPPTLWRSQPR